MVVLDGGDEVAPRFVGAGRGVAGVVIGEAGDEVGAGQATVSR